jgi:hypothetical protein
MTVDPVKDADPEEDGLRLALQAWNNEAIDAVRRNPIEYIRARATHIWLIATGEDYYKRVPADQYDWRPATTEKLQALPTYAAVRGAAEASAAVGHLIGQDCGSALGLSPFELWKFLVETLPSPGELLSGAEIATFADRYRHVIKQATAWIAEYRVVFFLQDLSLDADRLELEPGLAIERLSAQEREAGIQWGLATSPFTSLGFFKYEEGTSFALVRTWKIPRIIGRDMSDRERDEIAELVNPSVQGQELLQCLALLSDDRVHITGTMTSRVDDDFTPFAGSLSYRAFPAPLPPRGAGLRLDADMAAELQQIWREAHDDSFPQNKALALAVCRLGFATQRERPEDRLIDVFIAAEAFYLTDAAGSAKDRGDLKYRLALRAAVWSEGTLESWTRREVLAQMRLGYDLRSAVAHGGEPKPKDIKVKGLSATLPELVSATENIVRTALRKAMREVPESGRRLTILWDDLILLEENEPEEAVP